MEESLQVCEYMSNTPGMSISSEPAAPLSADYLYLIDLSLPKKKKQDILAHLDANATKPAREATAVVFHGSENIIKEYVVGPLTNPTYHRNVTFKRYKRDIPLTVPPVYFGEHSPITML